MDRSSKRELAFKLIYSLEIQKQYDAETVELFVRPNAVIKDLSVNLQNRIKEAIKKTADLEVKEVNIKIRNIASEDKQELK